MSDLTYPIEGFAPAPAESLIGLTLDDPRVPTPSFIIDDRKLEANLERAKARAKALGVTLRPHLKTHKSIKIARRQMVSPEGPATVSTLAEARYFAANGVKDLIYAVGIAPQKLAEVERIRALGCDLKIILDSEEAARLVSDYCMVKDVEIPVLLEVDVDGHRSGIQPESEDLLKAARALTNGAKLVGVLTHAGDSYECKTIDAIREAAEAERAGIVRAAERLRAEGFLIDIVSLGSTPTLMFAESEEGVTEIRAGVCALFDLFMTNVGACSMDEIAGSVLTTVIGRQTAKNRVITDSGFLAMSRDRGTQRQKKDYQYGVVCLMNGEPVEGDKLLLTGTNQEHGIITIPEGTDLAQEHFPVGLRLRILPNHACPTVAPYAHLLLVRDGHIVDVIEHVRGWE
ncbi:alanine racemase [Sutterella sp.]|uniref:alanine racemase n=1 Tax=Sutterella sp. TaxID=1981025 RepID=UPI0026E0A184|nr:alanine racemase [Sutterella sp.]MDO5530780.1 alanine racemase [Sutterella sp.]